MSAPFVPADDSERNRFETSSLDARYRLSLMSGYSSAHADCSGLTTVELSDV